MLGITVNFPQVSCRIPIRHNSKLHLLQPLFLAPNSIRRLIMNLLARLCAFLVISVLVACSSFSETVAKGIESSDEKLLSTLASLARRGEAACNRSTLERELGIQIGVPVVFMHDAGDGILVERQTTEEIFLTSKGTPLNGTMLRFRSASASYCSFGVQFLGTSRLCNSASQKTQAILGGLYSLPLWGLTLNDPKALSMLFTKKARVGDC